MSMNARKKKRITPDLGSGLSDYRLTLQLVVPGICSVDVAVPPPKK
jgi:hypothetical protein